MTMNVDKEIKDTLQKLSLGEAIAKLQKSLENEFVLERMAITKEEKKVHQTKLAQIKFTLNGLHTKEREKQAIEMRESRKKRMKGLNINDAGNEDDDNEPLTPEQIDELIEDVQTPVEKKKQKVLIPEDWYK